MNEIMHESSEAMNSGKRIDSRDSYRVTGTITSSLGVCFHVATEQEARSVNQKYLSRDIRAEDCKVSLRRDKSEDFQFQFILII